MTEDAGGPLSPVELDAFLAEPRVGVLIDEEARRHRRVQMTATAAVVEGPVVRSQGSPRRQELDRLLVARYMADTPGQAYAQLTADRPRFLVELTPVQLSSWRGGPWHRRYYQPSAAAPPPTASLGATPRSRLLLPQLIEVTVVCLRPDAIDHGGREHGTCHDPLSRALRELKA